MLFKTPMLSLSSQSIPLGSHRESAFCRNMVFRDNLVIGLISECGTWFEPVTNVPCNEFNCVLSI